jgi:hypothetical protein
MLLNSKTLQVFLRSKTDEITSIIRKNATKSPEQITREIITKLDYSTIPLSLLPKKGEK